MLQVQIVAIYHSDKSRVGSISSQFSTKLYPSQEAILNGDSIFLIFIVTPEIDHRKPFLQAVESGKAAYVEKPFVTSLGDALSMAKSANNAIATCGCLLRFESRHAQIKRPMGQYGRLCHMHLHRHFDQQLHELYGRTRPAHLTMTHDINIANWYGPSPSKQVLTRKGRCRGNKQPDHLGEFIEYENGATSTLKADWLGAGKAGLQHGGTCSVFCEKGEI